MSRTYKWSYFPGGYPKISEGQHYIQFNPIAETREGTLDDLLAMLGTWHSTPSFYSDGQDLTDKERKNTLPSSSGAHYLEGSKRRGKANVVGIDLLYLDIDGKNLKVSQDEVESSLRAASCTWILYHSFSSTPEHHKMRVVLPLESTVKPELWKQYTVWALSHLGLDSIIPALDLPAIRDTARIYFLQGNARNLRNYETRGEIKKDLTVPPDEVLAQVVVPPIEGQESFDGEGASSDDWETMRAALDEYKVDLRTLDIKGLLEDKKIKVGLHQKIEGGDKWRCHCPWWQEHTDQNDDDGAYITMREGKWSSFRCSHSGCQDRGVLDVMDWAGVDLVRQYAEAYERPTVTLEYGANGCVAMGGPAVLVPNEMMGRLQPKVTTEVLPAGGGLTLTDVTSQPVPVAASTAVNLEAQQREQVRASLRVNRDGSPKPCLTNLTNILLGDPLFGGRLQVNEMGHKLYWYYQGRLQQVNDLLMLEAGRVVSYAYGLDFKSSDLQLCVRAVGDSYSYNPVRSWLANLHWDGVSRTRNLLTEVFGLDPDARPIYEVYLRKLMIGMVARMFDPGAKQDTCLVLVGPQGRRKSTFFEVLAGSDNYGSPRGVEIDGVDSLLQLHCAWLNEIQEVDRITSKVEASRLKSLLSTRVDRMRAPYARASKDYPRQFSLVGTANDGSTLLRDSTGSRRWWVMDIGEAEINISNLKEMRDQLWAEAVASYKAGATWWLDDLEEAMRTESVEPYEASDEVMDLVLSSHQWMLEKAYQDARDRGKGLNIVEIVEAIRVPESYRHSTRGLTMLVASRLKKLGWVSRRISTHGQKRILWVAPGLLEQPDGTLAPEKREPSAPSPGEGPKLPPFKVFPSKRSENG